MKNPPATGTVWGRSPAKKRIIVSKISATLTHRGNFRDNFHALRHGGF
jgi:hypothetical protein